MTCDVADESLLCSGVKDFGPESTRLLKVELSDVRKIGDGASNVLFVLLGGVALGYVFEGLDRRLVVGADSLVVYRENVM